MGDWRCEWHEWHEISPKITLERQQRTLNFTVQADQETNSNNYRGAVLLGDSVVMRTEREYPDPDLAMVAAESLLVSKMGELFARQSGNE